MRSGQRGGQREERTATTGDTKKGSIYILKGVFNKKGRIHLKGSSLIERVVFDVIKRHIVTKLVICIRIDRGQREGHEVWTARRTTGGAASYKFLKKKLYDFFHNLGL